MLSILFPYGTIVAYIAMVLLFVIGMFAGMYAQQSSERIAFTDYSKKLEKLSESSGAGFDPSEPQTRYLPWANALLFGAVLAYLLYHFIGYLGQ